MQLKGLKDFILGLFNQDGKLITGPQGLSANGIFVVDLASSKGAIEANITGINANVEQIYGSNELAEQMVGAIRPKIELAANDIPHDVYDKCAGLTDSSDGGFEAHSGQIITGAAIIHSTNMAESIDCYLAFPMGIFVPGSMNLKTDTQNGVLIHDSLTLNCEARSSDGLVYKKFYSDAKNFDKEKMLADIFPGYSVSSSSTSSSATVITNSKQN